jgi:hypothetical protein
LIIDQASFCPVRQHSGRANFFVAKIMTRRPSARGAEFPHDFRAKFNQRGKNIFLIR